MTELILGAAVIANSLAIVGLQVQLRRRPPAAAGICGAPAPVQPFVPAIALSVCQLAAGHTGWHHADQPGGMGMDWGPRA